MNDQPEDQFFVENIRLEKSDSDLIDAYTRVGRSVDDLAYTPDFEKLAELYHSAGNQGDNHHIFKRLLVLRKSGLLPRIFRPANVPA